MVFGTAGFQARIMIMSGPGSPRSRKTMTQARHAALAALPEDAAKRLFGLKSRPAAMPPQAIGAYSRGCMAGAVPLPADGPNWQVMRPIEVSITTVGPLGTMLAAAVAWGASGSGSCAGGFDCCAGTNSGTQNS